MGMLSRKSVWLTSDSMCLACGNVEEDLGSSVIGVQGGEVVGCSSGGNLNAEMPFISLSLRACKFAPRIVCLVVGRKRMAGFAHVGRQEPKHSCGECSYGPTGNASKDRWGQRATAVSTCRHGWGETGRSPKAVL